MKLQFYQRVLKQLWVYLLIALFAVPLSSSATHFRYGNLTWSRVPGTNNKIRLKASVVLRHSFFSTTVGYPFQIGSQFTLTQFNTGVGANAPITAVVTSVDLANDIIQAEWTNVVTYSTPGNYVARTPTFCCRIVSPPLVNNPGNLATLSHIFPTLVQVGPGFNNNNDAPVSSIPAIINFPELTNTVTYQFPAVDPNGDALTFSLSANGTFGTNSQQPAGFSISSSGLITWSTTGITKGKFYYASVRITDAKGAYTTTDFMIKIVGQSAPPVFDPGTIPPGTVVEVQPGDSINIPFKATDPGDSIKVTAAGIPIGSTFDSAFKWVPADTQQGTYVITVTAEDTTGVQTSTSFSLDVSYKPRFDIPTMPGNNSVFVIKPGDTFTHPIKAYHPTVTDGVILTQTGASPGMTFTPSFPIPVANPVQTGFSWTPLQSQWGLHRVVYQAQDTFYLEKAYDTIYYIVDNPPVITSTPTIYVYVGDLYNYLLTATDLDIPNGDVLKVENISKPGFLSVTDNNNATFNIAGIPTNTDIGTHPIAIEVSDSFNHFGGTHVGYAMQNYDLIVLAALDIAGTPTHVTINGGNNGAIDITPTGGKGPYTYLWSNGATTQDIMALVAGTYFVTVTDSLGKTVSDTFVVNQPDVLTVSGNVTHVTINGQSTGAVDITPAGGVGPYTYVWSNGATTQDITSVPAGTYAVTVTDANGATVTDSFVVNQPDVLTVSGTITHVGIYGQSTGAVDATPTGGVGPYTYSWNNSATTEDITNVLAGTYVIVVTDANGATATDTFVVNQPAPLMVSGVVTHVTIYGQSTGAVNATVNGGVGPYTYSWSNSAITEYITNVPAGTYVITVADANGAIATDTFVVNQPAPLVASGNTTDVTINGGSNGSVNITPNGGVGPYTYVWSNGSTSEDISGVPAGSYTVTITDANGATFTDTYVVGQPALLTIAGVVTNVGIYGQSTGAVDATPAGGVGPYTYLWSNGATTQDISGVPAGTYGVIVTDVYGATANNTFVVYQPDPLTVTGNVTDVTVYGQSWGVVDIHPAGGVGPYTYVWSNGATSQDLTSVPAGTYTVTITDANGATVVDTYTVNQPAPLAVTGVVTDVAIFGQSTGAINATVTGGVGPYTYVWSNGATTEDLSGVPAGTYYIDVIDVYGAHTYAMFVVNQPALLTVSGVTTDVTIFGQNTGAVNITPAGGVGPYTYLWSNGATTQDLTSVPAGSYTVTVTDANGATVTDTYVVNQPAQLLATANITDVSINGGSNGAVNITPTGGVGPYTYAWSNGATTEDISSVPAGSYTVTITDANGATYTNTYVVNQPAALVVSGVVTHVGIFGQSTGAVNATITGGVGPYTYAWSNGATTEDINGVPAGTYVIVVTDANGATATDTFVVNQPAVLAVSGVVTHVGIFGQSTGTVNATVTGGVGPYTYSWSNGATTEDIANVPAGTYVITVTDANGAIAKDTFIVNQPAQLLATANVTHVTINGQSTGGVNITVTGGVGPYTYAWSNGATTEDLSGVPAGSYTVTVTDANGATYTNTYVVNQPAALVVSGVVTHVGIFGQSTGAVNATVTGGVGPYTYSWSNGATTEDIANVPAGTYVITVTDANGAIAKDTFIVNQPAALAITGTVTNVTTNGGSNGAVNITVTGGVGPYTYAWSNGATTEDLTGIPAGTYTVTVTDSKGATKTATYTVTQPAASIYPIVSTCTYPYVVTLESVTLVNGKYEWVWSVRNPNPGNGNNGTVQDLSHWAIKLGNCASFSGIVSAATSSNGTNWSAFTPTCQSDPSIANTCGINTGNVVKFNVGTSGAAKTYYKLVTTQNLPVDMQATAYYKSGNRTGCGTVCFPGFGCAFSVAGTKTNVKCYGENSGAIDLSVTGGKAPYTYSWSNGATTQDLNNLAAGTYIVTVTDANNAVKKDTFVITAPATAIAITGNKTNVKCKGDENGKIDLSVSGGTGPYTYSWSNGTNTSNNNNSNWWNWWSGWCNNNSGSTYATTQNLSGLEAGTYTVTVTDANGCTKTASYTITEPASALSVSGNRSHVACNGGNNGAISVSVSGGISPYSYKWNDNVTTQNRSNLSAGNYSVEVTDANGCVKSTSFTISQPSAISISGSKTNVKCYGESNGSITLNVCNGSSPYSYSWSDGSTSQNRSNLGAGTYVVTVTDANGCSKKDTFVITAPTTAIAITGNKTNVKCKGDESGKIDISVIGGTAPYSYSWSNGTNTSNNNNSNWWNWWSGWCNNNSGSTYATTQNLSGLEAGTYTVTVTDANGCTKTASYTITEPASALSVSGTVSNVSCGNNCNGGITLSVSGGTAPYTYKWNNNSTVKDRSNLCTGSYSVVVTDANGCTKSANFTVGQSQSNMNVSINVNPSPTVSGQQPRTIYLGYGAQSVTLNASVSNGGGGYSYSWWPTTGLSNANSASPVATPTSTRTYTVTVTDANGCTKSSSVTITVIDVRDGNKILVCKNGDTRKINSNQVSSYLNSGYTLGECDRDCGNKGISEEEVVTMRELVLYPNPTQGVFYVQLPEAVKGGEAVIMDMNGKVIERKHFMPDTKLSFDLSYVPKGVYMVQIANGGDVYKAKVTIQE